MKLLLGLFAIGVCHGEFAEQTYQDQVVTLMLEAEKRAQVSSDGPSDKQICYGDLGCYQEKPIGLLPEDPNYLDVKYRLYTEKDDVPLHVYAYNSEVGEEHEVARRALQNKSRPLIFVAHGFGSNSDVEWAQQIRFIQTVQFGATVILIDWRIGARIGTLYTGSAANTQLVGRMSAHLALRLTKKYDIPLSNVQFIGHSLGGQMAGYFASDIFEQTKEKVGKLTCLDSASPLFEVNGIVPNKAHTRFLEAIHTSAGNIIWRGKVGVARNYGHVDFYPNGGIDQPGCSFPSVSCAHSRSTEYYIEAIRSSNSGQATVVCQYNGYHCDNVEKANRGDCEKNKLLEFFISMFGRDDENDILFLKTKAKAPYCWSDYTL